MSLPRPPKAVVFDMDGLLIDSETVYRESLLSVALERELHLPVAVILRMVGLDWVAAAQVLNDHFGAAFDAEAFRGQVNLRFRELCQAEVALKTGVLEILDRLDVLELPYAIVTSSHHDSVRRHIGGHGLLERFRAILAHGDYPRPKPAPDPYLAAAALLGLDPADILALEDSHNGVRAAAGAGMMTIMVPDMLDPTEEMHGLCVRIARDLHEVRELLD
jgi:HAD superfamily hydrolase (TIGR01509 family)